MGYNEGMAVRQEVPEPRVPIIEARGHEARLQQLKRLFPEAVTEGKVNFDKLKALLDEQGALATGPEPYDFRWMGKAAAYRTISLPSYGTLRPCPEESVNFEESENLFIEGDNLEVMKILRNSYFEKIRMIYIDPPYNTGKEFIYPDNFREGLRDYLKYSGQIDDNGFKISTNTETNGRYHSKWLSMMYSRLSIARDFLRDDGMIFISIDDNELYHLRMLMNEIFGEENFYGVLKRRASRKTAHLSKGMTDICDYVLIYSKSEEASSLVSGEIGDSTRPVFNAGNKSSIRIIRKRAQAKCADGIYPAGSYSPRSVEFRLLDDLEIVNGEVARDCQAEGPFRINQAVLDETLYVTANMSLRRHLLPSERKKAKLLNDLTDNSEFYNEKGTEELTSLFGHKGVFNHPKPSDFIKYLIKSQEHNLDDTNSIIMDFFAGSCPTAQAVMQLNAENGGSRRFICIQLPEPCSENLEAFKAGYKTIAGIGKERIRLAIRKISSENSEKLDLENNGGDWARRAMGFKVFKLSDSNFKLSDSTNAPKDSELLDEQIALFAENLKSDRSEQDFLYEILLRTGQLLTAPIEKKQVGDQDAFFVNEGALVICLESRVTQDGIRGIIAQKPERVICLDNSFTGNDQLKTNTVLEMKSNSIHFQTI